MKPGLYEQIINRQMNHELESIPEDCKHQEKDMSDTIEKVKTTFESYWNDNEFVAYNESQKERLIQALRNEKYVGEGEVSLSLTSVRIPISRKYWISWMLRERYFTIIGIWRFRQLGTVNNTDRTKSRLK